MSTDLQLSKSIGNEKAVHTVTNASEANAISLLILFVIESN
ncbi:MAG: hypothetical protein DSZ04_03480 [Sulfurimonas sp.]|nr:MAG: hypothetical protein DSZ04_03480 [Sulfurimonas sp.]